MHARRPCLTACDILTLSTTLTSPFNLVLHQGADVNMALGVSMDWATGQKQWDLFDGAGLQWRHVNITAWPGSPTKQPGTRGVPATAKVIYFDT